MCLLADYVFSSFSYLALADRLGRRCWGGYWQSGGRCGGHSAPINCHQVYDSAVAERVLSVHYHSSIAFSGRDVRPLRQDLSQTLWIFIRRCRFPHMQPGGTKPVPSSSLLKGEIIQRWSAFTVDGFGRVVRVWTTQVETAGLASQFRFYPHLYDVFPNENPVAGVYAKEISLICLSLN